MSSLPGTEFEDDPEVDESETIDLRGLSYSELIEWAQTVGLSNPEEFAGLMTGRLKNTAEQVV